MVLNWSRLMPELTSRYCGMCWYLSNSAAQAAGDSGGRMPTTGCHSVIDRPDRVSRVTPPNTTMTKIMPQQNNSHSATCRELGVALSSEAGYASAVGSDIPDQNALPVYL